MRNWEPSSNDATAIAAFRWFANALENEALELYLTDRRHFGHIESVLRRALKEMSDTQAKSRVAEEEDGCPDGWLLCDGICKPSCDPIES
jgi:hypothetical protein